VIKEKTILEVLRDYGLTDAEAEVYIFLAKTGVQKARDISSSLKMNKAQSYRILKDLETRGMVEQTLETPSRFTAIPFEKLLDIIIRGKRDQVDLLEDKKDNLLAYWRSVTVDRTSSSSTERVMVLEGRRNVYSRIIEMIGETNREFLTLTTELGVTRMDLSGILEAAVARARENRNIFGRFLAPITKRNCLIVKQIVEEVTAENINLELRHINLISKLFPRFVIKDEEEVARALMNADKRIREIEGINQYT
jgi:sugar-specific transcriptional regulator TrmB